MVLQFNKSCDPEPNSSDLQTSYNWQGKADELGGKEES